MLVKTIETPYEFCDAMRAMNRDYFSLEGYQALLDLFDCDGQNVEFDAIGICCEFSEDTPADIADRYGYTVDGKTFQEALDSGDYDQDEITEAFVIDYLNYHTWAQLLGNGNVIYQEF